MELGVDGIGLAAPTTDLPELKSYMLTLQAAGEEFAHPKLLAMMEVVPVAPLITPEMAGEHGSCVA